MSNFNSLMNGQPSMISISDFQDGKINQVGVENIKQKHDILGLKRGAHSGPPSPHCFTKYSKQKGCLENFNPNPYNLL
jgi:hypothetical protein